MTDSTTAIIVAIITTFGVVLVGLLQTFKKEARDNAQENREDHAIVQQQLRMIFRSLSKVDDKLDKHLDEHAEGMFNGKPSKRD